MKKRIALALCLVLLVGVFSACANGNAGKDDGKITIVATIFPEYDWVRGILGETTENVELILLLDSGVDLHSYQPTVADLVKISSCDLFLYVGGESDKWVDDALKSANNPGRIVLNLMDILGDAVKEEELVEGMQGEHEEEPGGEEEPEYDEHVWLSLGNARVICKKIAQSLSALDPDNKKNYDANEAAYAAKLDKLNQEYRDTVKNATYRTLVFGDRFPFRYLTEDYGLDYYAAFVGCSAESEADFETIAFLAEKVRSLGIHHVMTLEGANHKIAETVIATAGVSGVSVCSLDSMQSVTAKNVAEGATYLSIMEKNLKVLKEALE